MNLYEAVRGAVKGGEVSPSQQVPSRHSKPKGLNLVILKKTISTELGGQFFVEIRPSDFSARRKKNTKKSR